MNTKKILFFDIDGTLWDRDNCIPESTVEAIRLARANGHLTFINSGRSRAFIKDPKLFALGFDGVVSGCGTMIELHDETLFYHELPSDQVARTIDILRKYNIRVILEGRDYLYMDRDEFGDEPYGNKVIEEMGENLLPVTNPPEPWKISKYSIVAPEHNIDLLEPELGNEYDILIHAPFIAELIPKGFSKGSGIKKVCELLNADISDTYAFGDSVNDADMLKTAGTSVVMGNAADEIKALGDYVTTTLHEDGIYNACRHFGLI